MATGSDTAAWSRDLDVEQRRAVEFDGDALLIVAGAGTGKTRTIVARVARLISNGVPPERILLVTFSRRAADEMMRRLGSILDAATARQVQAGTFHSIAHRLLRRHGETLGLDGGFTILDQGDAADLMHLARQDVRPPDGMPSRRFPKKATLVAVYSRVVNSRQPLADLLGEHFPWLRAESAAIAEVFAAYTARKRARHLLDFDDLLLYWRAAVSDPFAGPALAAAYDHVLVDEYQDTNLLQADIVRAMCDGGRAVTVVGDDAQAIYSFRAATVRNIMDFPGTFEGASVITLERNYRSTQPILDLANAVIAEASERYPKRLSSAADGGARPVLATCPDEASQAAAVAEVALAHHDDGVALRDQAVLFRSAHHSDLLEVELRRRRIPFVKYGGLRFLEAAHVRDLLAALRVLDNPRDELAWYRLLQLLEGVGPAGASRAIAEMGVTDRASDPLETFVSGQRAIPARAARDAEALASALADCRGVDVEPAVQVERLGAALAPLIVRRYDNHEVRLRDFAALGRLAPGFADRAHMVAELTLDPPVSTGDLAADPWLDDDYLVLSTVHSAKGGEWDVVHVIHAADGMFPSDLATGSSESVEEERRLFYVALTRARRHLYVYAPLRYHHGGPSSRGDRHSWAQRSRFLPPALDALLDHRPVRASASIGPPAPAPTVPLPDAVDTALRGLW